MRERHAIYFLALGEADLYLDSAKANPWLNRLRDERYNLRSALRWSLVNDPEVAARLAAGLRTFWILEGYLTEGREWLDEALRRSNEVPASVRRRVLTGAGSMAQLQGDLEKARNLYAEGLAESRAAGDRHQLALATRGLGATAYLQGDFRAAREYVEEALQIGRELNDRFAIAASLNRLGDLARVEENFAAAQIFFEESIAILRRLGNITAVSNGLTNLGAVAFALADYQNAGAYFAEALVTAQEFGGKIVVSHALDGLAALAVERGDLERAARLAGAAEELRQVIGFQREPAETRFRDAYLTRLRRLLSEPTLLVAHEAGRKLKLNQAVALALAADGPQTPEKMISAAN
jgi:tetratricopeptide (TPR) repeat protein